MNTAGDSAEQIVRLSLEGMEVAFKIAGEGAKNIAVMICAMMKEKKQTMGKTRLTNLLKTGKELKIYSFKAEDLKKFSQEAKKYGILYCVLANKRNDKIDGIVDIMIKEEDAPRVNRIAERFKFADIDRASIARELEVEENVTQEIAREKTEEELLVDDILSSPKEETFQEQNIQQVSPSFENTEEKSQSEISLSIKQNENEKINDKEEKKSVMKELKEIEKEVEIREAQKELERANISVENTTIENTQVTDVKKDKKEPKHLKENTEKKGKRFKEAKHLETNINRKKKRKSKKKER